MGWASFTLAIQNSEQKQIKHIQKKHPILVRKFSINIVNDRNDFFLQHMHWNNKKVTNWNARFKF